MWGGNTNLGMEGYGNYMSYNSIVKYSESTAIKVLFNDVDKTS